MKSMEPDLKKPAATGCAEIVPADKANATPTKKIAAIVSLVVVAIALIVSACMGAMTRPAYEETVSPDYVVEHVSDRISSKLPESPATETFVDSGYRIRTRTLVVDAGKVSETDTIEDVYSGSDEDIASRLLYQSESLSTVYDFGSDTEYVSYLDVSGDNGSTAHPQDAVFAYDTTQGEMIDSVRYDKETGLAYIPKELFEEQRMSELDENQSELQAQTLVRYDLGTVSKAYEQDKNADVEGSEPASGGISAASTLPVEVSTQSGKVSKMSNVPLIGNQFAVKIVDQEDASEIEQSDIDVSINDGAIELNGKNDAYVEGDNMPSLSYNAETGDLNVHNVSPSQVMNLTVDVKGYAKPSMAPRAALATAGEIIDPTDNAYSIGHWGQANCTGATSSAYDARTKTIRRWGPGESVQNFSDITIAHLSDQTCAYIISIGSCPSALGSSWTANGGTRWKADCVHAKYPSGNNPPSGGYYKVLASDWNNQTITVAFFITCNSSGQEGAIVLTFDAPRNGTFEIYEKANANPSLGSAWKANVPNAVFGVYNSYAAAQTKNPSGLVKQMTTDYNGYANASFEEGTYYVRELSAPWPYIVSDQIASFSSKPRSKGQTTFYDDTVPPIQIRKSILPSANSYVESDIMDGNKTIAHIKTAVASDGKAITTEITAAKDTNAIRITNLSTTILNSPVSDDGRFDAKTGQISQLRKGETITLVQSVKVGQGWSNTTKLASVCSVSSGNARVDMTLPLHAMSLADTYYGIYADPSCTSKIGETRLNTNGIGYYGTTDGEWLSSNTTYYVKEVSGVNGYTVSSDVYPITTARNSQVSVSVADSFSTLILTKESGAGKQLTDKLPQFTLKGAKYGVFTDKNAAETHDESKVCRTLDGRAAVITTNKFGQATEVALGSGTYYVAELPSSITRPYEYGKVNDDFSEPADIDAAIAAHDFSSKSNGKFLLDEKVYIVSMKPGGTTFEVSNENIPVRIQLTKQSTRADLSQLSQFSLEGTVFGVYETEAAAKAAPTGNYKEDGFFMSTDGAVAILYGNKNGTTTVSWDLPLQDYYVKEIRAPKNYKLLGASEWTLGKSKVSDEIIHITKDDFLSSGKYIDGVLANTTLVKSNEPADVSVQVQKQASEVPDGMKNAGDAMSLAGARFAVYKSFEDAKSDTNRLTFKTDDMASDDDSRTDLLTSAPDGWTNKAIGLPAEACYWVREIEPPHVISDDPEQNAKNIAESMYVLDSEPFKATFEVSDSVEMTAYKDDAVKPVSITIGKYAMSMDSQGRNLHVGEKDANGTPYNDAYTDSAFAGALFGLFETREAAEAAKITDDVNDVSVEQAAYGAGALAVMTSDENGVCGTVDNLKWKADGYYVRELKAPTSGCYKRNESILQIGCDRNTQDSEHIYVSIDEGKISKHFEVDEMPNYYYVKIEKTSSDPSVLSDPNKYSLEGIHFGIYKTREEAEAATSENPGTPLYNLFTKKVQHDDGTTHYEAISGLTGPGVFWAKELIPSDAISNGFQTLSSPIRVEAKLGGIPKYDATPIVPENSAPVFDKTTGQLQYKTAKDIDKELGTVQKSSANQSRAALSTLNMPTGAVMDAKYAALKNRSTLWTQEGIYDGNPVSATLNPAKARSRYYATYVPGPHTIRTDYIWVDRQYSRNPVDIHTSSGSIGLNSNQQYSWMYFYASDSLQFFTNASGPTDRQTFISFAPILEAGYHIVGWSVNGVNMGVGPDGYGFSSNSTVSPIVQGNQYTVSFNANGGSGASAAKTATYGSAMPTVSKPSRTGYIFQGYYDAASGGTQYYKADGTSARAWNKLSNATLYAHWTPITYKVQYTATDPNASLIPGMTGASTTTTETYNKEGTLKSGIFHKFGYASKAWKYTADDGSTKILTPGTSKLLNLTAVNNKTVVLTAVWDLNEYWVKFNDGLSAQWGPAPVVESGTNPDTGTAWSLGYQQKLYYDDWSADGIASDTLTKVRYSHPNFDFAYWFDDAGTKYLDMQAVKNLAAPNQVKSLTGVWNPALDYGVDCEPNIIVNQPIGGITVQKVVKANGYEPDALTDLSGIVFELFGDEACTNSIATSTTDAKGIATFTGVETNKDYYVKEKSVPENLLSVMQISDEVKQVKAGASTSYEFVNECKQLSISFTKTPSQKAIDTVIQDILNNVPPTGGKFAVYASEQDALNDVNRIPFYDENGHRATVATVSRVVENGGIKCATSTLSGLPNQDLWIAELAAPSHGHHEYVLSEKPIFVSKDDAIYENGSFIIFAKMENEMPVLPEYEASKSIADIDLSMLPQALHDDAQELCDGIEYALYLDREDAASRASNYAELIDIHNSSSIISNLPCGVYYLIEWSLPETAEKAGISRSDKITTIEVGNTDLSETVNMVDSITTKKMHIKKTDNDTNEPLAGVVFDIYSDETQSELLCSTTATDAQGIAVSKMDLIPGRSYFVQERYDTMPSEYNGAGLGTDTSWSGWVELTLASEADNAFVVENAKNDEKGSIEVKKASNTQANLAGAVFTVYDATGAFYADMTTDDTGTARIDNVPVGTYTVKETVALPLHALTSDGTDSSEFEGSVRPNECWHVNDGTAVENYQGYVRIHKQSTSPEITDNLKEIYSLAGAVYSLYPMEDGSPLATPIAATLTTDENGNTEAIAVPLGAYKVVETTEPDNFSTPDDEKEFYIEVSLDNASAERAVVIESKDEPSSEPLANFVVEKRSAETYEVSDGSPQGTTSMANTKFAIEYSPEQASNYARALSVEKTKKWVIATDKDGRAVFNEDSILKDESDELYHNAAGEAALPVGTIVVREIIPPTGYTLGTAPTAAYRFNGATGKFEQMFADSDEIKEWDGNPTFTAANDIYRADISFHKSDAYDADKTMVHIPFALTLLDEDGAAIERHLVYTDENGNFSSKTGTIENVNENDMWIPGDVVNGCVDASFEPSDSRIWFSGTCIDTIPSESKGALIYGDYELREYAKDDTAHYQSLEPIYFSVRGNNGQSWIEINGKRVDDGNLTDAIGEIKNHSIHITSTEFLDTVSKTHSMGKDSLMATETIRFADATPGEKYIFETYAFDADTKEPITRTFEDVDGEVVETQAGGSFTLEAATADTGEVSIDVSFENYDIANRKIGLITKVYHNGYLSDKHNVELVDDAEAVSFTSIGTTATDADTTQHIGFSDGHVDIKDVIEYENLVPRSEYTVKGTLMDKSTASELLDAHGNQVESSATFVPENRNGQVEITFSFDTDTNTDFTAVAFEELLANGAIVAEHKDIDDKQQTVSYPSAQTVARDDSTHTFTGNPEHDRIGVIDTISYENLIEHQEYEARGFLYTIDANGNKNMIPGTETVAVFTPEAPSGKVEMVFGADADVVRGKRVLVGEEIWSQGKIVAKHDDVSFDTQIVSYPSVATTATDLVSGVHVGNGEIARNIVDIVHLEGLKPGETYRIDGTVMARSKDGSTSATTIAASETFTATSPIEDHKLIFDVPADFPAENAVVFERLSSGDGSHLLATHEDANDENQTIHYPRIGTVALHPGGNTHVGSNIDNQIVDTVSYENLLTEYEYEMVGMLVDKETGEFVNNAEGTAPVVSSATFRPENRDGSIDIPFDLNGIDVRGKTLVVFEKLFVKESASNENGNTLVATHCDIDSDKQSMFYPHLATTARDFATGTHVGSSLVEAAIIDTVEYTNLVPGYEYEVHGTLMDKKTGEAVEVDGVPATAITKFTPNEANGHVEVCFDALPIDVSKNRTLVVFEKLFLGEYEMSNHEDIDDEAQSVAYPVIGTQAKDASTQLHEGYADAAEKISVVDTVEYSNIETGREYTMSGALMDKETGKVLAEAETTFTPEEASGVVEVIFEMDSADASGHVMVAFEKLIDNDGNEIANHEDIDDEAQTVSYPVIATKAKDARTLTRAGSIEDVSIIDTVSYEGLLEGHEYTMYGTLMDKATQKEVVGDNGEPIVGETTFTAGENGCGEVEVVFHAQRKELAGSTFVAFERVEEAGDQEHRVIASHEDIDDEEQTIHYPKITRTLARADNGSKVLTRADAAIMSDTITYENIVAGIEYSVKGSMMNKSTEDVLTVAGSAIIEQMTFVPEEENGEIEVLFELDTTTNEIEETVVFEEISVNEAVVAEHKDMNSEDQSIHGVEAELIETGNMITPAGDDLLRLLAMSGCTLMSIAALLFVRARRLRW